MKTVNIFTAVTAALALSMGIANADDKNMEKCKVVKDGKGLIKAHKADCKTSKHSCAAMNKEGDAEAWIMVPKGDCQKINEGNFGGISQEIKDKIVMPEDNKEE